MRYTIPLGNWGLISLFWNQRVLDVIAYKATKQKYFPTVNNMIGSILRFLKRSLTYSLQLFWFTRLKFGRSPWRPKTGIRYRDSVPTFSITHSKKDPEYRSKTVSLDSNRANFRAGPSSNTQWTRSFKDSLHPF